MTSKEAPDPARVVAEAAELATAHLRLTPDEHRKEIIRVMRGHYILGGISAIDALIDALPAEQLLSAPPEARMMIAAIMNVCESFRTKMVERL